MGHPAEQTTWECELQVQYLWMQGKETGVETPWDLVPSLLPHVSLWEHSLSGVPDGKSSRQTLPSSVSSRAVRQSPQMETSACEGLGTGWRAFLL